MSRLLRACCVALSTFGLTLGLAPSGFSYTYDLEPRPGYLTMQGVTDDVALCKLPFKTLGRLEFKADAGEWRQFGTGKAKRDGCIRIDHWGLQHVDIPKNANRLSYRIVVPKQRLKQGGKIKSIRPTQSREFGPYFDVRVKEDASIPVSDTALFGDMFGKHSATILCTNPFNGRSSQGSAVSVPMPSDVSDPTTARMLQFGSTYLATAAHVVENCYRDNFTEVTVLYQGQTYRGEVWTRSVAATSGVDVGSVITNAPIPPVAWTTTAPRIGDAAVAIGSPGGVVGTVTQGQVVGVNSRILNLTVPSGPGGSGGPVFDNRGRLLGLISAGNGMLVEAQAWPSFCGTIYAVQPACSGQW